jgi:hypothetical protein
VQDGTTVYFNTYSDIRTAGNLATFNMDINSNLVRLLTTPVNAATTYVVAAHSNII